MKKTYLIAAVALVLLIGQTAGAAYNYTDAQTKAIGFFNYSFCGTGQTVSWRGNCHTSDSIVGGYHDAGDFVKFGQPLAFTMTMLCWADYEYGISAGTQISRGIDYIKKCGTSSFTYQIGDAGCDHGYWGTPEAQTGCRTTYTASQASAVMAGSAAALAAAYVTGHGGDLQQAKLLLTAAESAASDAGDTAANGYYTSSSFYDDICWANIWLYLATNDKTYLTAAETYLEKTNYLTDFHWTYCWDDSKFAALLKLAQITGKADYVTLVERQLDWWMKGGGVTYTPGGLPWLDSWGVLRYANTQAFMASLWADTSNVGTASKKAGYRTFAKNVLDYTLGTNPRNASYEIGFGSNWPKCPHYRAASPNQECPALHEITGAMVGGPDSSDNYTDATSNYQQAEPAIDYQACLVASLAAMIQTKTPPEYVLPVPPTPSPVGTGTGLTGEYFNNSSLTAPSVLTRTDATVNFNWGSGSPGTGVNSDQFSVRWTGQVQPRYTDTYTFYILSDDGSRVWVNNTLVADAWSDHDASAGNEKSGTIALTAGTKYTIKVEYYENGSDAAMYLKWSNEWLAKEIIPQTQLYPAGAPTNNPPTVSISSPANGATFTAPASITINATAADSDGTISSVAFYQGSTLLGTDTTSPYSYTWSNVAAGSYSLTARATDNGGAVTTSSAVSITVTGTTTVPTAPSGLTATAASSSQINLAWTDNSSNETGFYVERSTSSTSGFSQIASLGANVTTYSSTGLAASTRYYYRVRAYNSAGNSAYSNTANATTQAAGTTAPAAPSNLTATAASSSQINLAWTDNASNETGFYVERSTSSTTGFSQIASLGANVTTYSSTGLTASTTYYYRVRAYNSVGNSAYSNTANATTSASGTGCTCAANCSSTTSATAPYTKDGAGTLCIVMTSIPSYVNSWNTVTVNINGTDYTNKYVAAGSLPAKINGNYYIYYNATVAWAHIEVK
ncbi:MAG: glycoside hydrolase family 9 protein [Sedimentisphaerales bacterium]